MNFIDNFFPDYFTRSDRQGVILASGFSLVFLGLLIYARPPSRNKKTVSIAKIESILNNVKYKESGSVSFYDVTHGENLQNNDEVFTSEAASAKIKFLKSNTILNVPQSSLIKIEDSGNGESIEVKQGVVDIVLEKGKGINVKINGVDHQLIAEENNSVVKAFLSGGELHFYSKDKGVKINGSEEMLKDSGDFSIQSPMPGERIEYVDGLKIKVDKKNKYNIELSKFADFSKHVLKTKMDGVQTVWEQPLEEGNYYLRIQSASGTKTIPISVASKYKIDGMVPGDGELVNLTPGQKTTLRWNPKPVSSYKVTVKDGHGVEKKYVTKKNELVVDNLKGSTFEWTVVPEVSAGKYPLIQSTVQPGLRFSGKIEFNNSLKNRFKTTDKKISLVWNAPAGEDFLVRQINTKTGVAIFEETIKARHAELPIKDVGNYKIEVSSVEYPSINKAETNIDVGLPIIIWDHNLKTELKSPEESEEIDLKFTQNGEWLEKAKMQISYHEKTKNIMREKKIDLINGAKIKLDGFGEHCFRAILNKQTEGFTDSDDYCINYIKIALFPPLPRAQDIVMEYEKHNGVDSYKIAVPAIKNAAKYKIEIYREPTFKTLVYTVTNKDPVIYWASNRSGIYFLRYKVMDIKNRESDYSPVSKLIFPISPLSNW